MSTSRVWSEATLPFDRLSAADFERLCCALLDAEGHSQIRHWGAAGSESGCDLVSTNPDGQRVVTQCKRVQSLGPAEAVVEVRKILDTPPTPPPAVWSLIATCTLSRKTEERLAEVVDGVFEIELCGETELDQRVRRHADLVDWFFGPNVGAAVEAPLWWMSSAPKDRTWAEALAKDLLAGLQRLRSDARLELAIPSDQTPWPEVPPHGRWGLVLVTPEAMADSRLRSRARRAL